MNGEVEYDPQVLLRKYEEELKNLKTKITENQNVAAPQHHSNNKAFANGYRDYEEGDEDLDTTTKIEASSQVEKYKGLLLKQRDIMIALTARLNNRDETIIHLQGEIEHLTQANSELQSRITKQAEKNNELNFMLKSGGHHRADADENNNTIVYETPHEVRESSKTIREGLDSVITALTKENGNIDLHEIAQRLLGL